MYSMENTTSVSNVSSTSSGVGRELPTLFLYTPPSDLAVNIELALMAIVVVFGVPGNILIISVQANILNKTTTDYLVMIMAMYELFGSSVNAFTKIAMNIESIWNVVSSPFVCKVLMKCCYKFGQYGSALMLGALAIDRCVKTLFPLNRWYNVRVTFITSVCIFLVSLALSVPSSLLHTWDPTTQLCGFILHSFELSQSLGVASSAMMLAVFIVISIAYGSIALFLKQRHRKKVNLHQHWSQPNDASFSSELQTDHTAVLAVGHTEIISDNHSLDEQMASRQGGIYTIEPSEQYSSMDVRKNVNDSKARKHQAKKHRVTVLTLEGRNINRVTVLMFLISLFYVLTNMLQWVLYVTSPTLFGYGAFVLSYSIPMLNCVSNPVMFFSMSSRFRHNVKAIFCSSRK